MKRRTQWIAILLLAGGGGCLTAANAHAGPGAGPYGPWNSSGAYGSFGPYEPYVRHGYKVSQGLSDVDYTRTVRTTWVRRGPHGARRVTIVEESPARPWESTSTVRRTAWVGPRERVWWTERPAAPRTTGEAILDTVTIPVRVVRDVAVIGGRAVGTVVRTPERVAESIRGPEPVGERIVRVKRVKVTRSCQCRHHPRRTASVTTWRTHPHRHSFLHRTGRTLERVGERTGTTIKHTAKRTGRTLHHAAHRTGRTLEHVGEHITGRGPEPVGERRYERVGPAYPNADNDYNNNIDYNNPYR